MSDRKRNRWGDNGNSTNMSRRGGNGYGDGVPVAVSDQDALAALVSSAETQQRDRNEMPKRQRHDDRRQTDRRSRVEGSESKSEGTTNDSYYGPAHAQNRQDDDHQAATVKEHADKQKPNFGLSGALSKDTEKGRVYKGVQLKFSEPPEARAPNTQWRLYVFKEEENIETLHIAKQSAYLLGRNETIADIPLLHTSCSSQHAVIQYRALPNIETAKLQCSPYLLDLESTNGSFINGIRLEPARYYQLKKGDVVKFGASKREYVLLTANTTSLGK